MTVTLDPGLAPQSLPPQTGRPTPLRPTRPPARLALRLARRELRRRPWRTALVVLMVVLPTAAMTLSVAAIRTGAWTAEDQLEAVYGQSDATAQWYDQGTPSPPTPEAIAALEAALPEGSHAVVESSAFDRVRDGEDRFYLNIRDLALNDPMADGRVADLRGRVATTDDEVVLNDDLAERMGVDIGSTIHPDRLGRDLTVVGIATFRGWTDDLAYVGAPLTEASFAGDDSPGLETSVLVDVPGRPYLDAPIENDEFGVPVDASITAPGWTVTPIDMEGDADVGLSLFWTYVMGGVTLVILGTIITAAFAISARRQLRTVGLLSSTGASPRTVKRFLILQGAVTGAIGAALGIGIGLLLVFLFPAERMSEVVGHHVSGVVLPLVELVPILLLGTLGAAAAAGIPARSASKVSTLQALAGRRPLPRVPTRMPAWGVISLLIGAACFAMAVSGSRDGGSSLWALIAVAGALATLAGVCFISPWVVARLDGFSARFPYSWRLAGRSLARNRVRSSAVIGAIAAVAAALVTGSTLYASDAADDCCANELPYIASTQVILSASEVRATDLDPDGDGPLPVEPNYFEYTPTEVDAELRARVAEVLPDARQIPFTELASTSGASFDGRGTVYAEVRAPRGAGGEDGEAVVFANPRVGVASIALLDEFGVPDELRRELGEGRAVVIGPWSDDTTFLLVDGQTADRSIDVAGIVHDPAASWSVPTVLISEATARDLGYDLVPGGVVFSNPDPLTRSEIKAIDTLQQDLWWEQDSIAMPKSPGTIAREVPEEIHTEANISYPSREDFSPALIRAIVLVAVFVLMLAVVAIGLALAGKDSDDERQVLAAIGAPPRTLRRVGALRGVLLVGIAVLLAIPAGLLPAAAILEASDTTARQHLALDWPTIGFLVVAVPLVTGTVVWIAGRIRDLVKPMRPDTFAFGE